MVNITHTVFIALGSNLGDRLANLQAAIQSLPPAVRPLEQSPVYETAPWGYTDQPDFLNQVVKATTDLSPEQLLTYLKSLEAKLGRSATFRYGPRLIDLDILLYDNLVLETPRLSIPHPRLAERAFVLFPLADLAPDVQHPVTGKTVRQMRDALEAPDIRLHISDKR